MSETIKADVIHYGPGTVPDPDHSTYIRITRNNEEVCSLSLRNDQEIDTLIEALINARVQSDGLKLQYGGKISGAYIPEVSRVMHIRPNNDDQENDHS